MRHRAIAAILKMIHKIISMKPLFVMQLFNIGKTEIKPKSSLFFIKNQLVSLVTLYYEMKIFLVGLPKNLNNDPIYSSII